MFSDDDGTPLEEEIVPPEIPEEDLLTFSEEITKKYDLTKDELANLIKGEQIKGKVSRGEYSTFVLVNEKSVRAYLNMGEEDV